MPSDRGVDDYFGWSVSLYGNIALIGSVYDDDKGSGSGISPLSLTSHNNVMITISNVGSAYFFMTSYGGSTWSQRSKVVAFDGAINDYFGYSVSIHGNNAVICSPGDDDKGSNSGIVAYTNKYCMDNHQLCNRISLLLFNF